MTTSCFCPHIFYPKSLFCSVKLQQHTPRIRPAPELDDEEMDNPVKEISAVILSLCTRPQVEQEATIAKYFLPEAAFVHPLCRVPPFASLGEVVPGPLSRVTGLLGEINSRRIIRAVFRWYKILSPDIDIGVVSIAWDEAQNILYVGIRQRFALWFVPLYAANVRLVTELQLVPVTEGSPESRPVYYISRQEDHYQPTEVLKFILPRLGPFLWEASQLIATWLCLVGVLVVDTFLGLFRGKRRLA